MKKLYRTREGSITAVDTRTALATVGSETAPGPLLVPQGMKYIIGFMVSHIASQAAATSYSALFRVEGPGLKNGPECVAAGAGGNAVATGGNVALSPRFVPLNLPVIEGNEVQIFGEMCGTDVGQLEMAVTVIFSDELPSGASEERTFTVEGDITAADTRTLITTQGSVTAPSPVVPSGVTKIKKIIVAAAAEGLADGFETFLLRLGGNSVLNGEQVLNIGSSARIAVQSGSDAAPQVVRPEVIEDVDIEVRATDTLTVAVEGAGTDVGTARAVVTLVYA